MSRIGEDQPRQVAIETIPRHIRDLFGRPPVLSFEDHDAYECLLSELVVEIEPSGIREWLWVRDLADLNWDILRIRRAIASLLEISFKPALVETFRRVLPSTARYSGADALADQWYADPGNEATAVGRSGVVDILAEHGLQPESVVGQAFALRSGELEMMERMLTSVERRRSMIMRELEVYRDGSISKRARNATIDAEPGRLLADEILFGRT
jgi:hypothetical protein